MLQAFASGPSAQGRKSGASGLGLGAFGSNAESLEPRVSGLGPATKGSTSPKARCDPELSSMLLALDLEQV